MHWNVLLLTFITIFGIGACNNPFSSKEQKPYKVTLLEYDENGKGRFVDRTLETLEDPVTVESSQIKIRINSKFYPTKIEDQIPRAIYRVNSSGVLMPMDTNTMMYYGLYYNMEQLLKFDKAVGLNGLLTFPRVLSIQTEPFKSSEGVSRFWKNNLAYMPGYDRIVVYKFDNSHVPAPLNLGLIAHEHFHAIFERLVRPHELVLFGMNEEIETRRQEIIKNRIVANNLTASDPAVAKLSASGLTEDEDKIFRQDVRRIQEGPKGYNFLMLNALSEGLSDYWSWLMTGHEIAADPTFKDVEELKLFSFEERRISPEVLRMLSDRTAKEDFNFATFVEEETSQQVSSPKPDVSSSKVSVRAKFYYYGAMYAKLLRAISNVTMDGDFATKRVEIGRWIIGSLTHLRKNLELFNENKDQDEYLSHDVILSGFVSDQFNDEQKKTICGYMKDFLSQSGDSYSKIKECQGF